MYLLIIVFYHLPEPYTNLSSNMVLIYFPKIILHYWRTKSLISFHVNETAFNNVTQMIRAPVVDISRPLVTLKEPIKHVFVIVLESIRADALPLNNNLANAVKSTFTSDATAENVTPLLNSLWMNSVRTVASVTSSYTLKSLVSIFCGIYPLNVNFLKEANSENFLYEKCLPELLREIFQTTNNQSTFRSAFFTAARDDFDHQRDLFNKLKFDTIINGFDIYEQTGNVPDLGMFGPADQYILPLMWKWIDKNLAENETNHLMMSLLVTGTHEPFPQPNDWSFDEYRFYIDEPNVNNYLNALHATDDFLKEIFDGFKLRKLYDDTLFIITSDHGYVFNDYGRQMLGLLSTPLECAFSVPLMLHNPHLEAKQLDGQFTNMDILPTIMDILLSSIKPIQQSTNQLLSVPNNQLQSILSRYEGTSILRMLIEKQPVRYTFHLTNPGNSYIIVKQYPKKLTYDISNDEVHLYHLEHDPFELVDLIHLDYKIATTHPPWINVMCNKHWRQTWKGRWTNKYPNVRIYHKLLLENKSFVSISTSNSMNNDKVQLKDMLDWADQTLELARFWKNLVKQRYRYESKTFNYHTN
ncbi:unnamed protein product [Rotaria sordida]|uniref:Sulfatase N-terminal domain-containing protein n=1 Tax=Rotaria sordida TaxID=392033 RepID=A0A814WEG4_9BILA|nr:unnamed protein product [Rotaria sordida]CAF1473285.1 unnamed protein product [Rotaria sordida]